MPEQSVIKLNNGTLMPQLGLGVWKADNQQAEAAVNCALETGYRAIDTAAIYKNEQGVGRAIASSSIDRQAIFITTKLWNSDQRDPRSALEKSLQNLQLDYVDLYLIHWPCPADNQYLQAWEGLIDLQQQGLVKNIGVCNFNPDHLKRLITETKITPVINQIELHPLFQQKQLHAWNAMHNIQTESWSPLAQGGEGVFDQEIIKSLATKYQKTPAQIVIRWHIDSGLVVIPKSVTPERITENFAVFDFQLDKTELTELAKLDQQQRLGPYPEQFNQG